MKTSVITSGIHKWHSLHNWTMAVTLLFLISMTGTVTAQSLTYSNAIVSLNAVGYWPMHEVATPAPADVETNYGSLGALGNGYYADWAVNDGAPASNSILHQIPGPLANGSDVGAYMLFPGRVATNSYLLVPHTSPLTTLNPPFTIELWVESSNYNFGDIVSQDGTALNGGNANNKYGIRLTWGSKIQTYGSVGQGITATEALNTNQWHYVVLTVDSNRNWTLYGDNAVIGTHAPGSWIPDSWDPLTIGAGMWNGNGVTRETALGLSEVAIYTNALSATEISNHWAIATNALSTPGEYYNAVISDNPLLYFRMDSPSFLGWQPTNTWPVLTNYGTSAGNGVYMPGVAPGRVAGPDFFGLSGTNAMAGNGVSAFADAGFSPVFNPTNHMPLSVTACFKGNPADSRYQNIVGHSDDSWRIALDPNGKVHFNVIPGGGSDAISAGVYNDGNWHQVVGVYDGTSNYIYVDGVLEGEALVGTNAIPGSTNDVLIGADPQYLQANTGAGRQFAGNICEVAFFTNALTVAQVQTLYNAAGVPLYDLSQPLLSRVGSSDVFSVTVKGSSPAYQWYFNTVSNYSGATALTDGGGVSGSTTASLTIANLSDYYFVVANNDYNAVTSSIVQVPQVNVVAAGEPIWNQAAQTNVVVAFSGALDPATAVLTGNYGLDNGASVFSAALAASNEVVLTTSALDTNTAYTLTVQNVENNFGAVMSPSPTNLAVGVYPANIALWIRADSGVLTNADGTVYQWNDQSGNGNNLYTISGIEPQLTTNANGNPAVHFEGTNATEMDAYSSSSLAITGDMSVIAVMSFDTLAGSTNGDIVSKTGVTHANVPAPYDYNVAGNGSPTLLRGNGNGTANGTDFGAYSGAANSVTVSAPQILAVSEVGNTVSHFVDGKPVGTGLLSKGYQEADDADQGQDLSIGMRTDQHNRLSGTISELIVAGSSLSSYDVGAISGYLGAKYSIGVFNPNPTNIVFSTSVASGTNELTLSWPVDHTGWTLQAQTNSMGMGLSTNWVDVPNSSTTNQMVMPINPTNGSVFYRLIYSGQ